MQLLENGRIGLTAADVAHYRRCPWAWLKQLETDVAGGYPAPPLDEPIRELMASAATEHRERVEGYLSEEFPEITRPSEAQGWQSLATEQLPHPAIRVTWSWMDPQWPLELTSRSDALITTDRGQLRPVVSKLGRSSMRKTELIAAGGVIGLKTLGLPADDHVDVAFANGDYETRALLEAEQDWNEMLGSLAKDAKSWQAGEISLDWWDSPADQCGRLSCAWCVDYLSRHDDVFHTAGLRRTLRRALRQHGIFAMAQFVDHSVDELSSRIPDLSPDTLQVAHRQASLQVASLAPHSRALAVEVINSQRLAQLPTVSAADVYLDFEGDPSYRQWPAGSSFQPGGSGPSHWLGIDYLIGVVDSATEQYSSWWSESFEEEGEQFRKCVEFLRQRQLDHPTMRIFHYAGYEQTALQRLAERHQFGQDIVQKWIDDDTLVDLYREVLGSVAIGSPSYSLKKLEPLYFSPDERAGISGGAESVVAFRDYLDVSDDRQPEQKKVILEYNRLDCLSTKRLHQWLLQLREHH